MCQSLRLPTSVSHSTLSARAYLELGVAVVDEDVGGLELGDVAMTLKLLPHLGANGGDWDVEGVHGLDLGGLGGSRLALVLAVLCLALVLSFLSQSQHFQAHSFRSSRVFGVVVPHAASPGRSGLHVSKHPPSWRLSFLVSSMASVEGLSCSHT